jgi:hypothetical protein
MSRWGNFSAEGSEDDGYVEAVTVSTSAFDLLQRKDFVENVKARSSKFTKKYK